MAEELILFRSRGQQSVDALSGTESSRAGHALHRLLIDALLAEATDVHLDAEEGGFIVRFRVDGCLRSVARYDPELGRRILSCIKVLCDLDITRRDKFQDGAFGGDFHGRSFDFRVSVVQELYGETLVCRVLPRQVASGLVDRIGLSPKTYEALRLFCRRASGTLIVAGPTGAGKTTTLYALLQTLDRTSRSVVSIEDPVEYQLPLMTQIPIDPRQGISFAAALRSVLRQDPNVLMIGEIRDLETAEIALQSALTGHLILSTTHGRDAIGALARLLELGLPGGHLGGALDLLLAQRLARKLCERCKTSMPVDARYFAVLGFPMPRCDVIYTARGCSACGDTGYRGRIGVFELLQLKQGLRDALARGAPESELYALQEASGDNRMIGDALLKVEQGILSMEEVSRVLAT